MSVSSVISKSIEKIGQNTRHSEADLLAVEEPLEIRLKYSYEDTLVEKSISVTMRTPGNDFELVTGFLFTENIIADNQCIDKIYYCSQVKSDEEVGNILIVVLKEGTAVDLKQLERHFYTSSSCGVCGKSSIEAIRTTINQDWFKSTFSVKPGLIMQLPKLLKQDQLIFDHTGGLHAAGLFDLEGNIICLREDVGRHNALDKLVGAMVHENGIPLTKNILVVSGRLSFELVQKALRAGIQMLVAIGAPSSLAVQLAESHSIALIGFVKNDRFNVYTGMNLVN